MADEKGFDPRFDPAFQRGWDGSAEHARRKNATPSLSADDIRFARSAPPEPLASLPPLPPESDATLSAREETDETQAPSSGHNPFIVVLWIIGVVLVVGGIGLLLGPGSMFSSYGGSSGPDPASLVVMQVVSILCPAMVTVGLGTMSGLLFWYAARWKPGRK